MFLSIKQSSSYKQDQHVGKSCHVLDICKPNKDTLTSKLGKMKPTNIIIGVTKLTIFTSMLFLYVYMCNRKEIPNCSISL